MLNAVIKGIDVVIEKQGQITSFVIYPLLIVVIYEVFMRYAFNSPTIWGFEVTAFLYGIHYMLGLSFMENADGHVKVDIVTGRLPAKTQAVIGIISYLCIFTPVYLFMTWGAMKYAYTSTISNELNSTSWAPPIWPIKIIMAVAFLFLFIQGISNMLKHVRTLITPHSSQTQ